MKFVSYNAEFKRATAMLLDVFDNVSISRQRTTRSSTATKTISVPCLYGSRSRLLKSLENRNKTLKVPVMTISMTDISRDETRTHSVMSVKEFQVGDDINLIHQVATPVTITYEWAGVTRYQDDMDQLLSNFIAIMNPDISITWPNPKGQGNLKTQVIWDGSISLEMPEDVDENSPYRYGATTTFEVKTWVFPGDDAYAGDEPRILKINFPGICGGGCPSGSVESRFSRWYDVREYGLSMSDFIDAVSAGEIQSPNYDELGLIDDLSGSYWLDNVYAVLSGNIYDFCVSGDLEILIANEDDPDLIVTTIRDDGTLFTPSTLQVSANWSSLWRRMLSGDLSTCYDPDAVNNQYYKYLIKEESYLFLLYNNYTLIPLVTT